VCKPELKGSLGSVGLLRWDVNIKMGPMVQTGLGCSVVGSCEYDTEIFGFTKGNKFLYQYVADKLSCISLPHGVFSSLKILFPLPWCI
jgi:hypothetical protein